MGSKYNTYGSNRDSDKDKVKIHPIWRGVGFIFMVLIPIISYTGMQLFLEKNNENGWFVPTPDMLAKQGQILFTLIPDPWLYIKIGVFLLILLVLFSAFSLISFLIVGMFGVNKKNDPFYVPPVRRTTPRTRGRR